MPIDMHTVLRWYSTLWGICVGRFCTAALVPLRLARGLLATPSLTTVIVARVGRGKRLHLLMKGVTFLHGKEKLGWASKPSYIRRTVIVNPVDDGFFYHGVEYALAGD